MSRQRMLWIPLGIVSLILAGCSEHGRITFETIGADQLRPIAIVTFDTKLQSGDYVAQDHTGKNIPMQVDQDGQATLIMMRVLPKSLTRWKVSQGASEAHSVVAHATEDQVLFTTGGKSVAKYHITKGNLTNPEIPTIYHRSGYLHPVWTPSGRILTDDYPPDHLHHHGVWAAWTNTTFQGRNPDFWNMGKGTGRVEVRSLDQMWSGSVHAGLQSHHPYIDMTIDSMIVLDESWNMKVYQTVEKQHVFDVILTQSLATDSILVLNEHRYGGVGFRGHRSWKTEDGADFFTSEGRTREDGHATRPRWVHIGGLVDNQYAGIAILSHPDNYESPQPVRIHPTEPFFNYAPTQTGSFSITHDQPMVWRYRFVIYDGPHDPKLLEALWQDYASPLSVRIIQQLTP